MLIWRRLDTHGTAVTSLIVQGGDNCPPLQAYRSPRLPAGPPLGDTDAIVQWNPATAAPEADVARRTRSNRTNHGRTTAPVVLLALALAVASLLAARVSAVDAQTGCALPPVTLPLFQGTPAAAIATPAAPTSNLTGRPLTEDEQAEATQAVRTIVGCLNSGEPKDVYAVFTRRYLAALFTGPRPAYQPAFEQMIAEDRSNASQASPAFVLKNVRDGLMLEDGRIVVTIDLQGRHETWHDRLVLVQSGQHWQIDEVVSFDPPLPTPPAA